MKMREIRAMAIISKGDMPTAITNEEFMMPSQNDKNKKYHVHHKEEWTCDCPDFKHRKIPCKHIIATQFWLKMRAKANADGTFDIEKEILDKISCAYCGSDNIVKNGNRKTQNTIKQRFMCIECKRTFIENKKFEKFKGEPKLITLVMDLYFKGVSLRKIKDHISQFYDRDIHHETIRRWIIIFTKRMNDYVDQFTPQLSDRWHADEQFIKARNKEHEYGVAFAWNVMDSETRFLIASRVTPIRGRNEARAVMKEAKTNADCEPKVIITDKLMAYREAVKQNLPSAIHYRYKGFKDNPQNNKIERFHGTFRERDKVMRGLKGVETAKAFVEGFRTYYNFIRPHEGLNGLTPAQVAGINLNLGQNRWMNIIKVSNQNNIGDEK
ncbi:MAG: DDE-type integrase/transposase/recombinase [Nanoarchaeota archaeon]